MTIWEYKILEFGSIHERAAITGEGHKLSYWLENFGKEGWELVSVAGDKEKTFYFKRQRKEG